MMNELKELVSKGIEGGWKPLDVEPPISYVGFNCEKPIPEYCERYSFTFIEYSVPDLINDDDFMKSVYGEEEVEIHYPSFDKYVEQFGYKNNCSVECGGSFIKRFSLIKMIAIILSGDAQVKYLHKMMMEVKNGM